MAIAFALDFETVLEKVGDAVFQQSQASELSIWLPTRDGKEMRAALVRGRNALQVRNQKMPVSIALSDWVAQTREFLAKPDEFADIQSAFVAPMPEIGAGVSLPMLTGGRLIGILNFISANPQRRNHPGPAEGDEYPCQYRGVGFGRLVAARTIAGCRATLPAPGRKRARHRLSLRAYSPSTIQLCESGGHGSSPAIRRTNTMRIPT